MSLERVEDDILLVSLEAVQKTDLGKMLVMVMQRLDENRRELRAVRRRLDALEDKK